MKRLILSLLLFTTATYGQTNVGAGGGGSTPGGPNHSVQINNNGALGPGCTPPATNGDYNLLYHVIGAAAVDPTCPLMGQNQRSITGAATTDLVLFSDNFWIITHDKGASGTVNQTLPTATTLGNANFAYAYCNHSAQTDQITPTTWTIQAGNAAAGATLSVASGACYRIHVDSNSATNWLADSTGSSGASLPASAKVIGSNGSGAGIAALQTDVNSIGYAAGGGTAQAQTVTLAPAITAYADGFNVFWKPTANNNAPAPTLAVNGLTATTITKLGGTAIGPNDIKTSAIAWAIYNSSGPRFELQNPQGVGSVVNVTAVTATNPSAEATLMELALPAGFLNSLNQPYVFHGSGIYTIAAAQTPTLRYRAKLCTVSGCGSGTVVTLADIITTASLTLTNNNWNLNVLGVTNATGATGTLIAHGTPGLAIDLAAGTTGADTIFADVNTASSGTIDLTAALFVDFTILLSSSNAGNTVTQQIGAVMPQSNPAGSGSGGGGPTVQVNGSSTGITTTANFNNTTPVAPIGTDAQNCTFQVSGTSISCYTANLLGTSAISRWGSLIWSHANGGVNTAGAFSRSGGNVCTTAGDTGASATDPSYHTCGTGATANTTQIDGFANGDSFIGTSANPTNLHLSVAGKISATTAVRAWPVVISDQAGSVLGTSDTPAGNTAGIRFSSVAGDTNFMLVLCNAGTCTATSTGVAGDTAFHRFEIRLNDAGTATGCVQATCVSASTNYPASVAPNSTGCGWVLDNTTTTAVTFSFSEMTLTTIR